MSRNLGALTLLEPSGAAWPVMGVLYFYILMVSFAVYATFLDRIARLSFCIHEMTRSAQQTKLQGFYYCFDFAMKKKCATVICQIYGKV
jgi:hypothetical protein